MKNVLRLDRLLACWTLAALAALAAPAHAADPTPKLISRHEDWNSFTLPAEKGVVCYAETSAAGVSDDPKATKLVLMVTHRPAEKVYNVVSVQLGTDLPTNGSAAVTVGKQKFDFFTKQQTAWSRDSDTDKSVVTAMMAAKRLTASAKPPKGAAIKLSYSLDGFADALKEIDKACKVKR